jgi:hypothetical protein
VRVRQLPAGSEGPQRHPLIRNVRSLKSEVRGPTSALRSQNQKQMRHWPATSAALFVKLLCSPSPRGGEGVRWPAALSRSKSRDGGGGRNARAPARAYAHFWKVPRQFTLENRRLPLHPPQSSGELRNSHGLNAPTVGAFVAHRNSKCRQACAEAVDVAISLWKSKENLE